LSSDHFQPIGLGPKRRTEIDDRNRLAGRVRVGHCHGLEDVHGPSLPFRLGLYTTATRLAEVVALIGRVHANETGDPRMKNAPSGKKNNPPATKSQPAGAKNPASTSARDEVRPVAPKLIELSETVLYGDVWERPGLSKRDRSLITVATLTALGRSDQLP